MTPGESGCPKEVEARVLENRRLSWSGFLLSLRGRIPTPRPGQFVMLGLPQSAGPFLRRPFSVLEFGVKEKTLQIYYSVSGYGTRALSRVRPGEAIGVLGPLGRPFPLGAGTIDVVVGGGRGIAPLVFLSRKRSKSTRVIFFAGAAVEREIVLLDRVKADEIFVSTEDGSFGRRGTVIELLRHTASSLDVDWRRVTLYGCGPAGMLKRLHEFSVERGARCFVSLEARMGCGVGVCQGCAVATAARQDSAHDESRVGSKDPEISNTGEASRIAYSLVCTDGPVFNSDSIDWEAYEEAAIR